MAHAHLHDHQHSRAYKNVRLVFFINLIFTIVEIVGGVLTNSVAILSDAMHDFSDTVSLGISWYMEKLAHKGRDTRFTFGYKRFSLLAALISGVVLLSGSLAIFWTAIPRLFNPEPVHAQGMLWLALLGVAVNGIAAVRLYGGKTHHEGMLSLHLLEDAFGWVAVLVISIVMMLVDFPLLDPLLSLAITAWMLVNAGRRLRGTLRVFLQSIPDNIAIDALENEILSIPGVKDVHDTHVWSMDGEYHVFSSHVVVAPDLHGPQLLTLKNTIKTNLLAHDIQHATLELESEGEICETCE